MTPPRFGRTSTISDARKQTAWPECEWMRSGLNGGNGLQVDLRCNEVERQLRAASAMLYRQSDLAARRSTASSPFPLKKHSGKILSFSEIGTDLVAPHILWSGRFPAASNQIRMTDAVQDSRFSIYNSRSSRACRMTCGSTSTPVQYFTPITPCCTSIPSPSTVLQPRSWAA